MPDRFLRPILIASVLWISWLLMMLVHESGHVLGGIASGGTVRQMVWHPAILSRTDVSPNPHPRIEVWAGPALGSLIPLAVAGLVALLRVRVAYLVWAVAGFCLIANGVYLGVGSYDPVGDAKELILHRTPAWCLATFGVCASLLGLGIWNHISPRFGFGSRPERISRSDVYRCAVVAIVLTALGFLFGNRG